MQAETPNFLHCQPSTSAAFLSMPSLNESSSSDLPTNVEASGQPPTETTRNSVPMKLKAKRDLRNTTEVLLERQVSLVEEQVVYLQEIREELRTRNDIERQKLKIMEENLELKRRKYI